MKAKILLTVSDCQFIFLYFVLQFLNKAINRRMDGRKWTQGNSSNNLLMSYLQYIHQSIKYENLI